MLYTLNELKINITKVSNLPYDTYPGTALNRLDIFLFDALYNLNKSYII